MDASETLFIDDNYRNITAAEACGIQSIHFQSPALLIDELKKRGVI